VGRCALFVGAVHVLLSSGVGVSVLGCVEGVTPDCEDAAAKCGPVLDAAADGGTEAADAAFDDGGP